MRSIVLSVLIVACSSTTTPQLPATPTAASACGSAALARCARLDACTGNLGAQVRYGGSTLCVARLTADCMASLTAAGTSRTPAQVAACAAAVPSMSCLDQRIGNQPAACQPTGGTLTDGQPCAFSGQCKSTWCVVAPTAVSGICGPQPKAGDACDENGCGTSGLQCLKDSRLAVGRHRPARRLHHRHLHPQDCNRRPRHLPGQRQ